jgi:hypothetical protein
MDRYMMGMDEASGDQIHPLRTLTRRSPDAADGPLASTPETTSRVDVRKGNPNVVEHKSGVAPSAASSGRVSTNETIPYLETTVRTESGGNASRLVTISEGRNGVVHISKFDQAQQKMPKP